MALQVVKGPTFDFRCGRCGFVCRHTDATPAHADTRGPAFNSYVCNECSKPPSAEGVTALKVVLWDSWLLKQAAMAVTVRGDMGAARRDFALLLEAALKAAFPNAKVEVEVRGGVEGHRPWIIFPEGPHGEATDEGIMQRVYDVGLETARKFNRSVGG